MIDELQGHNRNVNAEDLVLHCFNICPKLQPQILVKFCRLYYKSSIQLGGTRTFCPLGIFLGLGVLEHFGSKNQTREIVMIHKKFEL